MRCSPTRRSTRRPRPRRYVDADKGVADTKAALDGARAILIERIGEQARTGRRLARMAVDATAIISRRWSRARKPRARSSPTTSTFARRCAGSALAPRAGAAARPQRGHSRSRRSTCRTRRARRIPPRARSASPWGLSDQGRRGRQVARRRCAARLEGATARRRLPVDLLTAAQGARRRRGDHGVLAQPQGSAAGRAGRTARHAWGSIPASAPACKVAVVDATGKLLDTATDLSARAAQRLAGLARDARRAVPQAQGRDHRHRQRHGEARDRQARRRSDRRRCRDCKLTKVMVSEAGASVYSASELAADGVPRSRRVAARRRLDRAAAAGSAGRAGQDRAQGDRRRPVPARRRPDRRSPARSMPWSRTA